MAGSGFAMRRIVKPLFLVSVTAGMVLLLASSLGQWIPDDTAPVGEAILSPGTGERITVEVRNAGGVDGMARAATDHLRSAGFDVVGIGNAARFDQQESVVIDRVGRPETAAGVARALGIDSVRSEPDPNLFVDVTVRLGSEWVVPRGPGTVPEDPVAGRPRRAETSTGSER
ncbi:MAG: LytR family transcriptional regulator [Gemmatimonadetes bacterium]|nr:LytR family transcriptional regulator [Gemmatimonadota bacterium]MYB99687.1 LytR family transcriptional regulator [Gemmatimonadota bacterium]MYI47269.1 LytR family transcriptional regulator [Gemmatimonadota bacterium]